MAFSPLNDSVIMKSDHAISNGALPTLRDASKMVEDSFSELENDYNIDVSNAHILVAGYDHSGAHIYVVKHGGKAENFDHLGFSAVGCGGNVAHDKISQLMHTEHAAVIKAIMNSYLAKKEADLTDPEVGQNTYIIVNIRGTQRAIRNDTEIERLLREYYCLHNGCTSDKERRDLSIKYQELLKPLMEHLFG